MPEDSHLLTVCSGCPCKGQWNLFQGRRPELQETASETMSKVKIKGRGCSIKLSKDYTGISWVFNSCRTGQRAGPVVLIPPTLTLWLTGVRTSSATTPDLKPSAPLPLGPSRTPLSPTTYFALLNVPVWAQFAALPLLCVFRVSSPLWSPLSL